VVLEKYTVISKLYTVPSAIARLSSALFMGEASNKSWSSPHVALNGIG
jgi:hypothetical protein